MNRLREEMKVVPRPFWVAAACVYLSMWRSPNSKQPSSNSPMISWSILPWKVQ